MAKSLSNPVLFIIKRNEDENFQLKTTVFAAGPREIIAWKRAGVKDVLLLKSTARRLEINVREEKIADYGLACLLCNVLV